MLARRQGPTFADSVYVECGCPLGANRGHSFSGHSLKDFEAILDAHYLGRDVQLAEGRQSAISINTGW
jgi:hypothetical protein